MIHSFNASIFSIRVKFCRSAVRVETFFGGRSAGTESVEKHKHPFQKDMCDLCDQRSLLLSSLDVGEPRGGE
jgi:hypothetical protein